jgi:hypothetical protein
MSTTQSIDYNALAQQARDANPPVNAGGRGGTPTKAPPVDYAAIADQVRDSIPVNKQLEADKATFTRGEYLIPGDKDTPETMRARAIAASNAVSEDQRQANMRSEIQTQVRNIPKNLGTTMTAASLPLLPASLAAAPMATGLGLLGSTIGAKGASALTGALGGGQTAQDWAGLGGGLLGGFGGGMAGEAFASLFRPSAGTVGLGQMTRGAGSMFARSVPAEALDTVPVRGSFQPALANTPREVLQYAQNKGIDLTAGQETGAGFPQRMEAVSERSIAGQPMVDARTANAEKLMANVRSIADAADPGKLGTSEETAGDAIQSAVKKGLGQAKDAANANYDLAATQQVGLKGDLSRLNDFVNGKQIVAGEKVYQTPAVRSALEDIADAPNRVGANPSIQSMRNLRTEFWEKGNDYTGNIPDSARALYKQAANQVDDSMMAAAHGTNFEGQFRAASDQWKAIQQKYNDPQSPLSRILQQQDPAKITRDLLNRSSANDIKILQGEGMDSAIEPLKRQVIEDVAKQGFRVGTNGLGGYSDSFLQQLFGPQGAKELYLNADLARRFSFQLNPSGTSNVMMTERELTGGVKNLLLGPIATKLSMPRPPVSIPRTVPISSLANPTMFGPGQP